MNLQNLFSDFIGSGDQTASRSPTQGGISDTLGKLGENIPGGLAGGAAAGGLMALLMTNKSARKFAGKAASYGGTALLGGLAYKAYSNWQHNKGRQTNGLNGADTATPASTGHPETVYMDAPDFQLQLIKSMIASAQADGHIDAAEQKRIFDAVQEMELPADVKGVIFDLLQQTITVDELAQGVNTIEEKSQVYLASVMVIDPDHPAEQAHLMQLAQALQLPEGLPDQLQWQARQALTHTA